MQYCIQRDRTQQVVVRVEGDQVKIFQRLSNVTQPHVVFLERREALTIAKIILREVS
jgi:hypothetical protein